MQRLYVVHSDHPAIPADVRPVEDILRLAAVGTWDTGRELKTSQAAARGRVGEYRVEDPGLGGDGAALYPYAGEGLGEPDGEAPDATVAHQHVRPPAEHGDRDAVLAGLLHGLDQFFGVGRFQQGVGGAPDLPRRVALEGLVELGRREESL